jgi:hypothetical protein
MALRSKGGEEKPATPRATPTAKPDETVHSHSLSDESFAAGVAPGQKPVQQPGQKICCVCGKDVSQGERFKDKKGRYWCYDCGVADSHKRHADDQTKCPGCGESFSSKDLIEHEGHHLCQGCVDKRVKAAKREASRKAAAQEDARASERKRKQIVIGTVAFAIVALGVAAWAIFF